MTSLGIFRLSISAAEISFSSPFGCLHVQLPRYLPVCQ